MYTIAIHPDSFIHKNGKRQSFSDTWSECAAKAGISVRQVDAYAGDFFERLAGCDGFMWRFDFAAPERLFAKRLLSAVEQVGIPVFPSWREAWHFEDKVGQHYLLQAAGIPTPRTWVFWKRAAAMEFARSAQYPLIIKFAHGYQSANVGLLRTADEAAYWIDTLFATGASSLDGRPPSRLRSVLRRGRACARALRGHPLVETRPDVEWQRDYVYLQEFIHGNAFDTRVTVIGNRAFAFRRLNRPSDFRASGSGRIEWNPLEIDEEAVRLAFRVAQTLDTRCIALDVLRRGDEHVAIEISYTFASWAVRDCPGHWTLRGNPRSAPLSWVAGSLAPDAAIFEDFVNTLDRRSKIQYAVAP